MSHLHASEVQPVIAELLMSLDEALGQIKKAHEALALKDQNLKRAESRCKLLEQQINTHKVYLEKVASKNFNGFSKDNLKSLQDVLVNADYCSQMDAVKIASELGRNPESAIQLAIKLANFSAAAPQSGCGFPKTASARSTSSESLEIEDWSVMRRAGA
jgi:hypothetical protein